MSRLARPIGAPHRKAPAGPDLGSNADASSSQASGGGQIHTDGAWRSRISPKMAQNVGVGAKPSVLLSGCAFWGRGRTWGKTPGF
jgi:hypothetical protein